MTLNPGRRRTLSYNGASGDDTTVIWQNDQVSQLTKNSRAFTTGWGVQGRKRTRTISDYRSVSQTIIDLSSSRFIRALPGTNLPPSHSAAL